MPTVAAATGATKFVRAFAFMRRHFVGQAAKAEDLNGGIHGAGEAAKRFLGDGYRTITNRAGDKIFMSKDGLRKIRFDFRNPHGDLPHVHLEVFRNGRWRDAISGVHRLYPRQ